VAGNATQFTGDATTLEALNTQVAALRNALSRQASGGTLNLTIADALWTKGVSLNPAYAAEMQRLFKASVPPNLKTRLPVVQHVCGLCRGWEFAVWFQVPVKSESASQPITSAQHLYGVIL
jgi:hypothetical protein